MNVAVVYARSDQQREVLIDLAPGTNIETAIRRSGLLEEFPEIDLAVNAVGIYGELRALGDPVYDGARVEIYRPLKADPKELRRQRARS